MGKVLSPGVCAISFHGTKIARFATLSFVRTPAKVCAPAKALAVTESSKVQ